MTEPQHADLAEAARTDALARFRLLRPHLEEGVALAQLARDGGIPLRTARRWLANYRRDGLRGLARRPRADRGQPRDLPATLVTLIEGLALTPPRRSMAAIQRQAAAVAAREGWPRPSYVQVRAVIGRLDPALATLAHDGAKVYGERFDLLYRHEASEPNAIWQVDHTQLDLWLLDDEGRPARPWLTVILDDYSRAVAGYYLTVAAPSALGTALVLHQAIWRKADPRWPVCGIPDVCYTDHGSDFTSCHLERVAADLQLRLVFSRAGQPRGRGKIERFFGTVNQLFLCAQPGYTPAGAPPAAPTLALTTLDTRFRAWLLDDYHHRIHGETRVTPVGRWGGGGFLPRLPESLEQLDLLLLTVPTPRRVQPDGIHFQRQRYLDPTLAAYVGEEVLIRYDPRDLGEIRVFHQEQFLCRAVCPDLAGETVSLREITAARDRRRRSLRAQLVERAAVVETLTAARRAAPETPPTAPEPAVPTAPRLKRYVNE